MTGAITSMWRHPIKSHGREPLETVTLIAGQTMPGDRVWAVAHAQAETDNSTWAPCANPETGQRDAGTLGALEHWGHRDFGVYAEVIRDGKINTGDKLQVRA